MKPASNSLGLLLHDAARTMRRAFELRAETLGLSSAQWRLLVHVMREGQATQARLAELLEVEPISVSRLVDRMEAAGWVLRKADPADRRVRLVTPTDKMQATHAAIKAMAEDVYADALQGFSADQRADLMAALRRLTQNLNQGAGDATKAPQAE